MGKMSELDIQVRDYEEDPIDIGRQVRITVDGFSAEGEVTYISPPYPWDPYYIVEMVDNKTGKTRHWKQRSDGGTLERVPDKPETIASQAMKNGHYYWH